MYVHPDDSLSLSINSNDLLTPTDIWGQSIWGVVESDSYQNSFVLLDCSSLVYYESLQITVHFTNVTQPLYCDISKNTLQIGDSNYTHIIGSEDSLSFRIDKDEEFRSVDGVLYFRLGIACQLCSGNITVTRVHDCYTDTKTSYYRQCNCYVLFPTVFLEFQKPYNNSVLWYMGS